MRIISLESVQPGMILGRSVYGHEGQILLKAGVKIKPQYISYLKHLGMSHLYVKDQRVKDIVDDVVREDVRLEARSLMKDILENVNNSSLKNKGLLLDDKKIIQVVSNIIQDLLDSKDTIIQLADLRSKDDYLFAHSVQCAIMATMVAKKMNFSHDTLKVLATGALLHDIGMAVIPDRIINKKGELTKDEYETVKSHSILGYEIFKKSNLYSSRAGMIILEHHERYNGQGYPKGLLKDKIYPLAQITSMADIYDALTSQRPYRDAYKPHEAVEILQGLGYHLFDLDLLRVFLSIIAPYPVGTHVVMSNRESGLVISNNPGFTLCPKVRILYVGEDLAPHPNPYDLNLAEVLNLTIVDVLS